MIRHRASSCMKVPVPAKGKSKSAPRVSTLVNNREEVGGEPAAGSAVR